MAGVLGFSGVGRVEWVGGDTVLIQVGDVVDRGPDSGRIIGLLEKLGQAARNKGGLLIPLLGNHEVMNLDGDVRYVSAADDAWFGGAKARAREFLPFSHIGSELRCHPVVARVGADVFVHAGILPGPAKLGVDGINSRARTALWRSHAAHGSGRSKSSRADPLLFGRDGVVWTRQLSLGHGENVCRQLGASLEALSAGRMVVGHTIQEHGRVSTRCDGRLVLVDVGMSDWMDSSPAAALEILSSGGRSTGGNGGSSSGGGTTNRTQTFVLQDVPPLSKTGGAAGGAAAAAGETPAGVPGASFSRMRLSVGPGAEVRETKLWMD
eukprot:g2352.t1